MKTIDRTAILIAVLGAYALRVFRLGAQELRGDEAFGYFFVHNSYAQIVAETLALEEPHPVLSYFIQKPWLSVAGNSESSLRFIGALFGVLAVALLFRLARQVELPVRISITGAVLLALSPYSIWHSQDARMYSMSMALALASTLCALLWLRRPTMRAGAAYVLVTLAALHVHYFVAFIIVAQNLYFLALLAAQRTSFRLFARWALWQAVLWLLYAPWLLVVRGIIAGYTGNGDSPGLLEAMSRAFAVFAAGESIPAWQGPLWAWLGVAAAGLGLLLLVLSPRYRSAGMLFGLYMAVPVLSAWYGALVRPIFDERYLAAAAPPFYALVAASLLPLADPETERKYGIPKSVAGVGGLVLVAGILIGSGLSLGGYYAGEAYTKSRGWRELARSLEALSACVSPGLVRLAQNYPDPTLWYYFEGEPDHLVLPPLAHDAVLAGAEVEQLVDDGVERVLFIVQPSPSWDAAGLGESALSEEYSLAATDTTSNWPVAVYARHEGYVPDAPAKTATFDNGAILAANTLASTAVPPGGVAVLSLEWDLRNIEKAEELKVFVQLLDEEGLLVGQEDRGLAIEAADSEPVSDSYGILIPRDLPPGEYNVIVGLYRAETGERLQVHDGRDYVDVGALTLWTGDPTKCPARVE